MKRYIYVPKKQNIRIVYAKQTKYKGISIQEQITNTYNYVLFLYPVFELLVAFMIVLHTVYVMYV